MDAAPDTTGKVTSRFVSETDLTAAKEKRAEEWKKAYERLGEVGSFSSCPTIAVRNGVEIHWEEGMLLVYGGVSGIVLLPMPNDMVKILQARWLTCKHQPMIAFVGSTPDAG